MVQEDIVVGNFVVTYVSYRGLVWFHNPGSSLRSVLKSVKILVIVL